MRSTWEACRASIRALTRAASSSREVGDATPDDEGAAAEDALFSDLSQSEGLKFVG